MIIYWHLDDHREHPALVYRSSALLDFFFFVFLVLHVAAHLVNALNFSENYNEEFVTLNAANYRGEVRQLSFHIFVLSISFKYMNICISQCHCVIYTVFLFHALKTHHCVDSCGFSFFLLTKHI